MSNILFSKRLPEVFAEIWNKANLIAEKNDINVCAQRTCGRQTTRSNIPSSCPE